jgi:hypothetical protein
VLPHAVLDDFGVSVHVSVPLHALTMQSVDAQVTAVPWQTPPAQMSPYVHGLLSSQAALTRHAHVPPALVQRYVTPPQARVWQDVDALQVYDVPALHAPSAWFSPQPVQLRPVARVTAPHTSAQVPAAV